MMAAIGSHKDCLDVLVAVAQGVSAIALIVYVLKTWQIATASLRCARTAERQSVLNEKTLRQIQVDRILVQKPLLVLTAGNEGMGNNFPLTLFNHGRGPAIDVRHSYDVNSAFALEDRGEQGFSLDVKRDHPLVHVKRTNASAEGRTLRVICENAY